MFTLRLTPFRLLVFCPVAPAASSTATAKKPPPDDPPPHPHPFCTRCIGLKASPLHSRMPTTSTLMAPLSGRSRAQIARAEPYVGSGIRGGTTPRI